MAKTKWSRYVKKNYDSAAGASFKTKMKSLSRSYQKSKSKSKSKSKRKSKSKSKSKRKSPAMRYYSPKSRNISHLNISKIFQPAAGYVPAYIDPGNAGDHFVYSKTFS